MHLPFDFIDNRHFFKINSKQEAKILFKKSVNLVEIETFSYCNRKCWFCPNSFIDRFSDNIYMEEKSYLKLLNELSEINYDKSITYSRYNEPLADKIILTRIKQAREILPDAHLMTYCNGDFVNREYIQELYKNGLNEINIMAYMGNNEEFTDELALSKMKNILDKVDLPFEEDLSSPGNCYITKIQYKDMKIRLQSTNFGKSGHNRGGLVKVNEDYVRTSPCLYPFSSMYIDYNCNVVPCCNIRSDAPEHKNCIVGNINENTIFEIYASGALVNWRKDLYNYGNKMFPCNSCNRGIYNSDKTNLYSFNKSLILKKLKYNPLIKSFFEDESCDLKTLLKKKNIQRRINSLAEKYRNKRIIIYGCGKFFYELQNNYDLSKLNIIAVADINFMSITNNFKDYKAIKPVEINNLNPDVILIAIYPSFNVEKYIQDSILPKNSKIQIEPVVARSILEKLDILIINLLKNSG
ncbi:MAG: radical SAM protein [Candidatus Gastranaerophilales bacterium]|nr:radical SAM protein [Candidatus Gastranaerophilales bacterium]